jgi:hypothetical protein
MVARFRARVNGPIFAIAQLLACVLPAHGALIPFDIACRHDFPHFGAPLVAIGYPTHRYPAVRPLNARAIQGAHLAILTVQGFVLVTVFHKTIATLCAFLGHNTLPTFANGILGRTSHGDNHVFFTNQRPSIGCTNTRHKTPWITVISFSRPFLNLGLYVIALVNICALLHFPYYWDTMNITFDMHPIVSAKTLWGKMIHPL